MDDSKRQDSAPPNTAAAPDPSPNGQGLLSGAYLAPLLIMAGGILLYAMNLYFTAALMPTVVADLGGDKYFAWAATAYLITAVIGTIITARVLGTAGAGRSYLSAFFIFGVGTTLSAISASMELFIVGRAVQGFGAGMLAALGYATIRGILPDHLWTRATGVVSGMFAVGALLGPAIGGIFGEAGTWRPGFWVLVGTAVLLFVVVLAVMPLRKPLEAHQAPVPVLSMLLLTATATVLSVSQMFSGGVALGLVILGLVLLVLFLGIDAKVRSGVFPRATYDPGNSLKWVYLTVAAVAAAILSEYFIPDLGQNLADLGPLLAGFLGAIMSLGWTAAQLFSMNARPEQVRGLVRSGLLLVALGVGAFGLLLTGDASAGRVVIWALLLLLAGIGIGMAFPHLTVLAMRSSNDPAEGGKAAAAISTTQIVSFTLTSAIAGNLLTLGDTVLESGRWVMLGITVLAILGVFTAIAATASRRRGAVSQATAA